MQSPKTAISKGPIYGLFEKFDGCSSPVLSNSGGISDTLSALAAKHNVPGVQFAVHLAGETIAIQVGELEFGTGDQVTRDSAFPIGSVSKVCTATAAMILVADGDLELHAPLREHLPELGDLGNDLTLHQVLSHTGGLAAGPCPEMYATSIRRYVFDQCHSENLLITPGTGFSYSNMGYVLAGHLIEKITGMSWWDAMESILLRPLKIEPAYIVSPAGHSFCRPFATGHSVNFYVGRTRPVRQSISLAEAPAGGLAMSAVDLVSLGLIQLESGVPALLPSGYTERMRRAIPVAEPFGLADAWGLGLAVFRCGNTTWVGHDGNADGTASYLRIDPGEGCVIAFTSNAQVGADMWRELIDELGRAGLSIQNYANIKVSGRPIEILPDCTGSYLNGDIEYLIIATGGPTASIVIDGEAPMELIVFEDLTFSTRKQPAIRVGRFLRHGNTGEINLIQVGGSLARRQSASPENVGIGSTCLADVSSSQISLLSPAERA